MSADAEVVLEMLERFNRGDYEGAIARLHENAELHQWGDAPDTDTYSGRDEFARGIARWVSGFEPGFQFVPEELTDVGDSVVARVILKGTGRGSGIELEQVLFQVYEVAAGKVMRCRVFSSEDDARAAAGVEGGAGS